MIIMSPMLFRQSAKTREPGTGQPGCGFVLMVAAAILLVTPVKVVVADKPKGDA